MLFINLPDANAFNARVEQLFVANDTLTGNAEIKLLEKLARRVRHRVFRDTLSSYRFVIFVLAGVCDCPADRRRRVSWSCSIALNPPHELSIERKGIEVNSLLISRDQKVGLSQRL